MFLKHPEKVTTYALGSKETLDIMTVRVAKTCKWYFQGKPLSSEDADYSIHTRNVGENTLSNITIIKVLPKHKGSYWCEVTDEAGVTFTSKASTLKKGKLNDTYEIVYAMCGI